MNFLSFFKPPYNTKLWSFALPWLVTIVFVLLYFPAREKASILTSAEREVTTLSEMLAFSVSEGLSENDFTLIQTAFDWAKRDSNIVFVSILDEQDSVIFEYNPGQRRIDRANLLKRLGVVSGEKTVIAVAQIGEPNQNHHTGSIILIHSLEVANAQIRDGQIISVLLTLIMCGIGLRGIIVLTRQAKALSLEINERKQTEAALRESNEKFHQLAGSINDVFWIRSPDLRELHYLSPAFEKVWGRSVESLYANPEQWIDFAVAEDRERVRNAFSVFTLEPGSLDIEYRIVRPDGEIRWINTRGFQVRDTAGNVVRLTGVVTDITERKRADDTLAIEKNMLRTLIDNLPDRIYVKDAQCRFLINNIAHKEALGAGTVKELIGKTDFDYRQYDIAARSYADDQQVIQSGQPLYNHEEETILETGERGWILSTKVPLNDPEGNRVGLVGISHDITERKRIEDQLRLLAHTITSVKDCVCIADLEDNLIFVNEAFCEVYGYSRNEILGKKVSVLRAASVTTQEGEQIFRETLAGSWHGEVMNRRNDGSEFAIEIWTSTVKDDSGNAVATVGVSRDITKRKHREEEIRKLSIAVEQSPVSIVITDLQGTIEYVNPKFSEVTGYSYAEAIGQNPRILKSGNMSPGLYKHLWESIRDGNEWHGEIHNKKKNGELFWEHASISPITNTQGKITHFLGVKEDITGRKLADDLMRQQADALEQANTSLLKSKLKADEQTEQLKIKAWELITAREVALEASRMKSEFVANMSHEIRTPMNGIIGMTSLLLDTELSPEQREYADIVRASGDALLTVVNDILDFSKMEAGKMSLEIVDLDLISVVEGTIELLALRAQEKGLELGCLLDRESLRALRGDPGRVRQVLTNLLGNAIKFTDHGEVTLGAFVEEETEQSMTVRFSVSDTGIGISEGAKKRIFQSFSQADGSTTRKYGGTGLGLAISKQLVELMGGTIGVDSEPGKGSTFWWIGKFEKQPRTSVFLPPRTGLAGLRCLIVDDNKTNRTIVHHYITSWGMGNGSAANGPRGLELLHAAVHNGHPYDLAILDMQMPDMDGMQLAKTIKADPLLANTRLILLTSIGNQNTRALKKAGFSAGLAKPVRQSQLFDCIANVMADTFDVSDEQITGTVTHTSSMIPGRASDMNIIPDPRKHLRILVAEDNAVNQKVAVRMLEKLGYRPGVAGNGMEAVAAVAQTPYDIVFMDCQMPEMDGFEATAEIRRHDGVHKHTTIVAMTANVLQGDREKCLAAGMDDYVSKPIRQDDLASAIDRWSLAKETIAIASTTQSDLLVDESILHEVSVLDDDDTPELLNQLINIFMHETPLRIEHIREAIRMGNPHGICETAHLIRGSCSQLGLVGMVNVCLHLEDRAESHALIECGEIVDKLKHVFFETMQILESKLQTKEA